MTCRHVAIIGNGAASLVNFRGTLIALLVRHGVRVSALAPDYDAVTRARVAALGADPIDFSLDRTGMRFARDARDIVGLWRLIQRLRPDCMLTYFVKPNIYGTMAGVLAGVPRRFAMIEGLGYVFTEDGAAIGPRRHALQVITRIMYKRALAHVAKAVFLNTDDIAFFTTHGLVDQRKIFNLGGIGVDLEWFRADPPASAPTTFILVARLLREKGIAEFLAAAAQVKRSHPETRFLLVGGSDPNPGGFPESEVRRAEAASIVTWLGAVDDVRPHIIRSSVFVLPSYREGLPRSTQEAMAMSRPVITTDVPGCRDTVEPGVNGVMVPPRSSQALAEAMLWFVEHPDAVATMGAASRVIAERDFNVIDKDRKLYAMLTGNERIDE